MMELPAWYKKESGNAEQLNKSDIYQSDLITSSRAPT